MKGKSQQKVQALQERKSQIDWGNKSQQKIQALRELKSQTSWSNKKNYGLRFRSHIFNLEHWENLLNSLYNLLKSSKFPNKKKGSTLLILKAVKRVF